MWISGRPWRRRSCWSWMGSRYRPRRCGGYRSALACGGRRPDGRAGCSSCANGGRGSANWCRFDGSPHDWFEGRGPRCTLIVFIDDATSRLTALRFAPVESGKAYLDTLRDQVLTHGRPLAFYSDRHGIFRVNAKDAEGGDGKCPGLTTEFGRVVERLEIGLINALTPQAKGRVERANQTYRTA